MASDGEDQYSLNATRRFIGVAIAAIALVVAVGAVAYYNWIGLVNTRQAESSRLYVESLWVTRFRLFTEQVGREIPAFSRSPALLEAIAKRDSVRVAELVDTTIIRLESRGIIDSLAVVDESGRPLFASSDDGRVAELPVDYIRAALQERRVVSGVGGGLDDRLIAFSVLPLFRESAQVAGAVVFGESMDLLLQSIADPTRMALAVTDYSDGMRAASRGALVAELVTSLPADFSTDGEGWVEASGKIWRATAQPLRFSRQASGLTLVSFTDETEAVLRERNAARTTAAAMVLSILLALGGIYASVVRQGERLRKAQAAHIAELDSANRAASEANAKLKLTHGEISILYARAEALRADEARVRQLNQSILDAAGEGIVGLDEKMCIAFANPQATSLLGYRSDELLGRELHAVLPEIEFVEKSTGSPGRERSRDDLSMRRKDGSMFPVTCTAAPVDSANRGRGVVLTFNDISRRKQAEEALAEQEERLRVIFDVVVDGVIIIDEQGIIQSLNPAAQEIFGYTAEELIGENIGRLMREGDRAEHGNYLQRNRDNADSSSPVLGGRPREVTAVRKDGTQFSMDLAVSEMALRGRRFFVGVVRDISERKEVERKLARYRDHLEELVDERTRELIVARDQARAGETAMAAFLANMSHEVRTPLHGILSYAGLGLKKLNTSSPEKLAEYFEEIRSCGTNLLALLNDLLDLSKLRAGKMVYDLQPRDVRETVAKVIKEVQPLATEKNLSIEFASDDCPGSVVMDETKIIQVLRNLLSNAIKFSHDGGKIEIEVQDCGGGGVSVTVADHGIGIPAAELDSVFDPFTQSTRTRSGAGGTGLGLAICREIIQEGHGGSIAATNGDDGGTRVRFTLPVSATAVAAEPMG